MIAFWNKITALARLVILVAIGLGGVNEARASGLILHQLFSSHMVLQRNASDPVWGWDTPGATITVKIYDQTSALIQTVSVVAGANGGRWQVSVGPFNLVPNNAAYTLVVSDGATTLTLTDILIGDVWLCSGQSNMQFSLDTIGVTNLTAEINDSSNYPAVREFNVPLVSSFSPQTNLSSGSWQVAGPATTGNFSASGYFTAREIYKQQHIPVGVLLSAYAGTQIQVWLDPAFVAGIADFTLTNFDQDGQPAGSATFSGLYNAMIAPLPPFSIKAVEWYQGEYNTSWPEQYSRLLPGLMAKWRSLWAQTNLPFVIVELPNFGGTQTQPVETGSWAELRGAQLKTVLNDPAAALVTTIDIGDGILHPIDKQDVGLRAAWAAADLVYGQNVVHAGPVLTGTTVSGGTATCTFTNVGNGLMVGTKSLYPLSPVQRLANGSLENFAVSGANKIFYAATATITRTNQVTVSSASVSSPTAVRYAWGGNPPGNLYCAMTDQNGTVTNCIPAGSLRNDPDNLLTVNLGVGTGYYTSNTSVTITASNLTAQTFDHWSGDTNLLSSAVNPSVTATQAQEYVSVLANFRITGAPSGVSAAPLPGEVLVDWNPLTAVHYNVKRSLVSGGPYTTVAADLVNLTNYLDSNVGHGTNYYYVVSATNLLGEGPDSVQVNAIPAAGSPTSINTWDANGLLAPNPVDGSGGWLTASNWWNGSTNVNGHWSGSQLDSALFGAGTAGSYLVNLGGSSISASNLTFATSGYTLTNGTLTLLGGSPPLVVNAGVTATLKNALTVSAASPTLQVGSGGVLSLASGATFNGNLITAGGGTVDLNGGIFSGGNFTLWAQTPVTQEAATLNTARIMIGYGGNSTYTLNSATGVTTSTGGGGDSLLGRAGTSGTLDLKQGTVTLTAASGDNLRLALDSTSKGTLLVEGGTLNLGGNILYINSGGTSSTGSGIVTQSGGTIITGGIEFGGGVAYSSGSLATLTMTGGACYLGSGGIAANYTGPLTTSLQLSGGTLAATANWSSSLPMTLSGTNGNLTFQAADATNGSWNISLSGILSGPGGLQKTGGGTLTLAGINTFTGGIMVNGGTLALLTTNNVSRSYTNNGGVFSMRLAAAGRTLPVGSLTFAGSLPQLSCDLNNLGNPTVPLVNCTNLALATNVTVNALNAPANGTSVLLTWSGSRTGSGAFVTGAVPPGATIVDDPVARQVTLTWLPLEKPRIALMQKSGNFMPLLSGTGGTAYATCRLLSTTNLMAPSGGWIPIYTNTFDANGNFSASLPTNFASPVFYRLVTP